MAVVNIQRIGIPVKICMHRKKKKNKEKEGRSQEVLQVGVGFTWLQTGLLHGSLSGGNGYARVL